MAIRVYIAQSLLGEGIPLFTPGRPELQLKLVSTQTYDKGLARQSYVRA